MTTNNNNQNSTAEQRDKALEEAVRLAEKELEVLRSSIAKLENKAFLLITACVALIGYLLSTNVKLMPVCSWQTGFEIIKILSLFLLTVATIFGGKTLDLGKVGAVGVRPQNSKCKIDKEKLMPLTKLHEYVIDKYSKSVKKTEKTISDKQEKLKTAKCFFICGLILAYIWEIVNFIEPFWNLIAD